MKSLKLTMATLLLSLIAPLAFGHSAMDDLFKSPKEIIATISPFDYHLQMLDLRSKDIEVLGVDLNNNKIDVYLNRMEFQNLLMNGYDLEVKESLDYIMRLDEDYQSPAEIEQFLKDIHGRFPEITKLEIIGKSVEGRNIYALKISDNADLNELEPSILFNSMHHAREVMTPEIGIDIIDYLTSKYGQDQQVTNWIDQNEIWVLPMLNVDGNNKVWNGSNMWRKNTQGGFGVDINRNYPYKWGGCNGSSGMKFSDTYRGPQAASEPETNALMGLVSKIKPVFSISYHSYSELVLYPYGCQGEKTRTHSIIAGIGKELGTLLNYKPGTPWEILYGVDGGDIDWMYTIEQTIPFVLEVSSSSQGFQPAYATWRNKTVERNRAGWQLLLNKLNGPGVRGVLRDQNGLAINSFQVKVFQQVNGVKTLLQEYRGNPNGSFHIVLNPGAHELEFIAGSRIPLKASLTIANSRIDLAPVVQN
jgi:carboxypeptidase T